MEGAVVNQAVSPLAGLRIFLEELFPEYADRSFIAECSRLLVGAEALMGEVEAFHSDEHRGWLQQCSHPVCSAAREVMTPTKGPREEQAGNAGEDK